MKRDLTLKTIAMYGAFALCFPALATAQTVEPEPSSSEKLEQRTQALEDAVVKLGKLKVTGYIQAQYQWGEQDASLKVGAINDNPEKSYNRIGIRRGRIKFAYEEGIALGVFQLDITEKGVGIKDAYLMVKDPWMGTNSLKAGVFDRPFGFEISYSSSRRESPERSTVFQTLFPEERDLGGMLTLQASKTSPWNFLKLEAGLFAGNGIKQETDNRKDFIGHLSASKTLGSESKLGFGMSYYNGGVIQGNENVYTMEGNGFVLNNDASNRGEFSKREYFGFDAQFNTMTLLGMTQLRGEYLWGTQPGGPLSSKSPNTSVITIADTYLRPFSGWYVMLVQDLGRSPLSAVVKYDRYDPNTKVSGDEVGQNGTTAVDLAHNCLGFGLLWRASASIRMQAYYELNRNEKTANLPDFTSDIKNDVFTLRLQYKF